ncbi:MAG: prenyltransferase/squalene oxidase repeat-containing protein [Acidobacteriaceae bacterium]
MSGHQAASGSRAFLAAIRTRKVLQEVAGLVRGPQRVLPLLGKAGADKLRMKFGSRDIYSYTETKQDTGEALQLLVRWIKRAQRQDGGIAAYYSLLTGYSESYPEVTGYIIPTLYDCGHVTDDREAWGMAERATAWLLSLQMPYGAFPAGLYRGGSQPSVFNTGQILQGLVRAYTESNSSDVLRGAIAAGEWLANAQQADGTWSGPNAYQGVPHTYYTMVSWALIGLSKISNSSFAIVAEKNLSWVLKQVKPSGWIDHINLTGHPTYLHFIAYVIQGLLECGILSNREDLIRAASKPAWVLLRKFEMNRRLLGSYEEDFRGGLHFSCLTGNAQMSCIWLRLFERTNDPRYLNAAIKMNELLKQKLPVRGGSGILGGVSGSYPIWGAYQPFRYISWGAKFFADALMLEQRLSGSFETSRCAL